MTKAGGRNSAQIYRDTSQNNEKLHRHVTNKRRFRAEAEERCQERVPYLKESKCSDEEFEHEESDHRGDNDRFQGPGAN